MKYIVRIEFRVECGRHDMPGLDKYRIIPQERMNGYGAIQILKFGRPNENSTIAANIKEGDVNRLLVAVDLSTVCIAGDISR